MATGQFLLQRRDPGGPAAPRVAPGAPPVPTNRPPALAPRSACAASRDRKSESEGVSSSTGPAPECHPAPRYPRTRKPARCFFNRINPLQGTERLLRWLRDEGLLSVTALTCLPLEEDRFEESMFRDLFEVTRDALLREEFLPALGGGHVSAEDGRLARTQELRDLLEPTQLAALEGETRPLRWVDGQVSQDRTPELRQYLMRVLEMGELTPEALLSRLDQGVPRKPERRLDPGPVRVLRVADRVAAAAGRVADCSLGKRIARLSED